MLEGILYQRYEQHRGYGLLGVANVEVGRHLYRLRQPYAHQRDVVLDEIHLVFQRHQGLVALVEQVAQHLRQLLYGILCPGGVEGRQRIDVVQRVQQEVRVDLVAQRLQLGLGARSLCRQTGLLGFAPSRGQLQGGGYGHGDAEVEHAAQDIDEVEIVAAAVGVLALQRIERLAEVHPEVEGDGHCHDDHEIV